MNLKSITNKGVLELQPYQPGKPIEEVQRELGINDVIKLASNENPLGPSPLAITAAQKVLQESQLYPDGSGYHLKNALAKLHNVHANQITLGNGSDNVLALFAHSFVKPGEEILISEYAFATLTIIAYVAMAKPIFVPMIDWRYDLKAMAKKVTDKTRLIFIANPNNPTGTYNTHNELVELLESIPEDVIVVMDEAYAEFMESDDYPKTLELMKKYPNLALTRTFSKIYGLAGLRLGYGISSSDIAEILNRVRLPFNVSSIALAAGCEAIKDKHYIEETLKINRENMLFLKEELKLLKLPFIPSVTNFITIDVKQDAKHVYEKLLHQGVIVRPLTGYKMYNYIRVTIGTREQNIRFINALKKAL